MKRVNQNQQQHTANGPKERGRPYTSTESLDSIARRVQINDSPAFRTTFTHVYRAYRTRDCVNKLNNELKPFSPMGTKTDIQPKEGYIKINIKHKVPNLKSKRNDFWYKGKKYSLAKRQYLMAESIFQFMYQNGETPWN